MQKAFVWAVYICAQISLSLYCSPADADYAMTINNQGTFSFNGNWTLGYEFSPNVNITVSSLGFFDWDQDGLAQTHDIGIWTTTGTLLTSAAVSGADPLDGAFRYSGISDLDLVAGNNYVIGGYNYTVDDAVRSDVGGMNITTSPDISIVDGRWIGGLAFPVNSTGSPVVYPPTVAFQYTLAVPEPASAGSAVVLLLFMLCRKQNRRGDECRVNIKI